MLHHKKIEVCM